MSTLLLVVYALGFALMLCAFGRAVAWEEAERGLPPELTHHPRYTLRLGLWTLGLCAVWPVILAVAVVHGLRARR